MNAFLKHKNPVFPQVFLVVAECYSGGMLAILAYPNVFLLEPESLSMAAKLVCHSHYTKHAGIFR
jgi:hypothetical protein